MHTAFKTGRLAASKDALKYFLGATNTPPSVNGHMLLIKLKSISVFVSQLLRSYFRAKTFLSTPTLPVVI